ncbi:Nitrate/nitrite sensor protein [hydrothermal vent metagenome]|uniref:histidine kinase n=1 Tax=hydrothermal vent metagenome TaxID=652676 RepID=A0A3B0Y801_9ZZZZ
MSFSERIYTEVKQMSNQHLFTCISALFFLLLALVLSSLWLATTETNKTLALFIQILLIFFAFVSISFLALTNQRKQASNSQQQHKAQQILFNITTTVNSGRELKELLNLFCKKTYEELQAHNVSVWLITENNWLEYITGSGIDPNIVSQQKRIKITDELKDTLINNSIIHDNEHVTRLAEILQCDVSDDDRSFYLPLHHHNRTLGVIRIKLSQTPLSNQNDLYDLFSTLAAQLCNAIEKAKQDQESRRMIIMQERSLIANELHDSLAQTLASLRFQVRVLDETLQPTAEFQSIRGIEQVENSLDEAYSDLRELIAHCRTPIDKQGLIEAVQKIISRMRKDSGIHILLQKEWEHSDLPPNLEMHIFRIVQEAMNNIRKHSNAQHVRLMFRCDEKGNHHILIENDGRGFETPKESDHPGKHVGISIMRERANYLGGELRVESDPDEGTRIELYFTYSSDTDHDPLQRLSEINS